MDWICRKAPDGHADGSGSTRLSTHYLSPAFQADLVRLGHLTPLEQARMLKPILQDDIREYEQSTDKKQLLDPKGKGMATESLQAWPGDLEEADG